MLVIEKCKRVEKLRKSKTGAIKDKCGVTGCNEESKRAVSYKKVKSSLPNLKFDNPLKRIQLCKKHYKEFKKATKTERDLERLTWE